ncbi:MAG: DUF3516 domain-containing protein [Cellulomonadaceae bacterium]|jgi:superfamily II RNA helicase|nr:DUF3516 domain-containing protein [Cellulomonadaceae bacterium]
MTAADFSQTAAPTAHQPQQRPAGTLLPYLPAPTGGSPDADAPLAEFSRWASDGGRPLYPHQEEALLEALTGSHVVLATPTGSGKSLVAMGAQFAALAAYRNGQPLNGFYGRTFYTAPLKALVSEKFFDLVHAFGSKNVGMMTGDSAVNADAPIICCTAEILANLALRGSGGGGASAVGAGVGDTAVGHTGDDAAVNSTTNNSGNNGSRDDDNTPIAQVIMDEFHFYGDPQRGWAWQVPLLELPDTQFILMSATLGDTTALREDIEKRTHRPVAEVTSAQRPVPLTFEYIIDPLTEVLEELVTTHRAPVYVVHFTQKEAVERAQSLLSMNVASRAEKDAIAAEIGDFRFGTGFGKTLSRFVRAGVGVHHAGMLPKYRRLVERLTQRGLLKVVCGTDTLGVGINVPIRTVLFTSLVKFDGERMRHVTAREFHQIAGRAGRAGFDTLGEVLVMAPEHVIDNRAAVKKAGDDPKKLKKIVRKKAPQGSVNWTDATFERLRDADPEPLTSHFTVNHAMVLNVLARSRSTTASSTNTSGNGNGNGTPGTSTSDPVAAMAYLLTANHDNEADKAEHVRQTFRIYRSLRTAGVVEKIRVPDVTRPAGYRPTVQLTVDVPRDFALNQALSPFALAAMDLLDTDSPTHALDVVSIIEATLDDPRQVLYAQQRVARGEAIAALKADGYDYEDRMAAVEDVTWPQPLADLLEPAFAMYRKTNPWVADAELAPKSVVRDMLEKSMTFSELVSTYGLERSEGVALRYLADAYRAVRQVVPDDHRSDDVAEIIEWLGELVRGVDSSLLDEWERLAHPDALDAADASLADIDAAADNEAPRPITGNRLAFRRMVRSAMFRLVELASREKYDDLAAACAAGPWGDGNGGDWLADALDPLFVEQGDEAIGIDVGARSPALLTICEPGQNLPDGAVTSPDADATAAIAGTVRPDAWWVRQVIDDYDHHHEWALTADIDLPASDAAGAPAIRLLAVAPM